MASSKSLIGHSGLERHRGKTLVPPNYFIAPSHEQTVYFWNLTLCSVNSSPTSEWGQMSCQYDQRGNKACPFCPQSLFFLLCVHVHLRRYVCDQRRNISLFSLKSCVTLCSGSLIVNYRWTSEIIFGDTEGENILRINLNWHDLPAHKG